MLEIRALGNLKIQKNGELLDDFGSNKAEAVLAYLAMEGGRHSRMKLAAMFWPESSEQKALASLRVVLSSLRKNAGEYLDISREIVRLKPKADITLDVHDFETKIAKGQLLQALDLYQGDFLEGLYIQDSNEFENWCRWEQERLHLLLINAFQSTIIAEFARGNHKEGQHLAFQLLKIDPLNEFAHRHYMIALALNGNRTDAMKHYQHYSQVIMEELGLEPSDDMENIKRLISQGDPGTLSQQMLSRNNLPYLQTSFIGREQESAHSVKHLKDKNCRLLTLVGPGGVGKTRLALNIARKVLHLFPDGVFFIQLEGVPSPDFLIPAIAESVQFGFDQHTLIWDSKDQLINFFNQQSVLLILDGFEHLADESEFLSELLGRTAHLKLLVTSRQNLNLECEWPQPVSGLPVPDHWEATAEPESSSLSLFFERAQKTNPTLKQSEEEIRAAIRICQLVEGFPLAVELAASWTSLLSCKEIEEEMEKSFNFLTSQMHDVSDKHLSLKAAFNYSWRMLDQNQKDVLARLSVFRGGFTRQAAKQVADSDFRLLSELLNKSLVYRTSDGRIDMHNVILSFTGEKLKEKPEIADETHDRHSRYFITWLQENETNLLDENMTKTRADFRPEIENLRAAANWAVLNWDTDSALEAVRTHFAFYLVHGWYDGVTAFDQLAAQILTHGNGLPLKNPAYLSCRAHQGWFCCNLSLIEDAEKVSQECLQAVKALDMQRELALCMNNLGVSAGFRGDFERSKEFLEKAIALGREHPFSAFPSYHLWLGYVHFLLGEYEEGLQCFQESYSLFIKDGNIWASSFALSKMGLAADGLGEHAAAMKYFQEAFKIFLDTGDVTGQAYSLSRMSIGAYFLEDYENSIDLGNQALELFRNINHMWGICSSLGHLGFSHLGLGREKEAQAIFYDLLEQASEAEMAPLCLYALAGIACSHIIEGNEKEGYPLMQYVQSHHRMPALYSDVAKDFLRRHDLMMPKRKKSEFQGQPLSKVIEKVFVHKDFLR